MRVDRLFHVLVVMSAPPAVLACDSGDDGRDEQIDAGAADPIGSVTPDAPTAGSGELQPCFCDVASCCDRSGAEATVLEGFECCWSTTCP